MLSNFILYTCFKFLHCPCVNGISTSLALFSMQINENFVVVVALQVALALHEKLGLFQLSGLEVRFVRLGESEGLLPQISHKKMCVHSLRQSN